MIPADQFPQILAAPGVTVRSCLCRTGRTVGADLRGPDGATVEVECPICHGLGVVAEAPECSRCEGSGIANAEEPVPCVTFRPKCCTGTGRQTPGVLVVVPAERCPTPGCWATRIPTMSPAACGQGRCADGYLVPQPGRVTFRAACDGCEVGPCDGCPGQEVAAWIHPDPAPRVCRLAEVTAEEWRQILDCPEGNLHMGRDVSVPAIWWTQRHHPDHPWPDAMVAVYRISRIEDRLADVTLEDMDA